MKRAKRILVGLKTLDSTDELVDLAGLPRPKLLSDHIQDLLVDPDVGGLARVERPRVS